MASLPIFTVLEHSQVSPPPDAVGDKSLQLTFFDFAWLRKLIVYRTPTKKPGIYYVEGDFVSVTFAECNLDFNELTGNHPRNCDKFYHLVPTLGDVTKLSDYIKIPLFSAWTSIVRSVNNDESFIASGTRPLYDRMIKYPMLDEAYLKREKVETFNEDYVTQSLAGPSDKLRATLILTRAVINQLKNRVSTQLPTLEYVSSFTVACAYIWSSIAKSRNDELVLFGFGIDCRGRMKPPISAAYFGNCVGGSAAVAKTNLLIGEEGFITGAKLIGENLRKTLTDYKCLSKSFPHPEARSLSRTEVGLVRDSSKVICIVSCLEDAELKTLIATYDIPLDLRPRLPDSNFRMSILPTGDTTIGLTKVITFEVLCQSLGIEPTVTLFRLRDIPEGVLVRSGLSRVWRNPMCNPVLRRSDNTVMSIHDFICMPSLEKATVREEPHELGTSILGRVADRTTPPAPAGTTIPRASPKEILSQRVSRAGSSGLAAGDEVEQTDDGTLNDDGQRDGSEFAREDVWNLNDVGQGEHINVIPLRIFDPSLGLDVTYPPILLPDKEVEAHAELSGGVRRTTRASSHASHSVIEDVSSPAQEAMATPGTQPLDTDAGTDEIASDGNVDSYFDARVSNTTRDVLERDLLSFVPRPYYIPYPYDENNGCESPPYTKDDWDEIHGVNLGLQRKELYKDPKVCRTAIDHFPTPAEIHRLHELSSVELSDRMSVLQCQLITHGRAFHARYDHSLREESTVHASEEVSWLNADLGALKSKCEATEHKLSSWDKKHRKYRSERDTLAKEKAKIEEELKSQLEHRERQAEEIQGSITSFFQSDFTPLVRRFLKSSEFNRAFAGVLNTAISVGVERGLRMGRTDEEFRGLSQRVAGFIPDAKEKFDRVIAAFPDTTFPFLDKVSQHSQSSLQDIARLEPDRVTPSSQPSSATASLRTNTHARHSTSSSGTFGHTSTPKHLKKKKKPVERGGPSAA
ncbi:malonyl-coenzyme A:anthocyanin 3-O-glucoside-6''-O-malonyltransferase-like protein [Tanacetum coccineum]